MWNRSANRLASAGFLAGLAVTAGFAGSDRPAAAQAKATKIHLQYTTHVTRVRPWPFSVNAKFDVHVVLSGKNSVQEVYDTRAGIFTGRTAQSTSLAGQGVWRVAGPNRLVRINNWPQSQTILTVMVTGQTCSVNVEYRLKPGFTEYKFMDTQLKDWSYFSEARFVSGTCTIENT